MQNSNAIVKKIYCIVINGKVEANMPFSSPEYAKEYISLLVQNTAEKIRLLFAKYTE